MTSANRKRHAKVKDRIRLTHDIIAELKVNHGHVVLGMYPDHAKLVEYLYRQVCGVQTLKVRRPQSYWKRPISGEWMG